MVKSGNKSKRGGGLGASPSHLMHRALQLALDIYSDETGSDGLTQRQFAVLEAVSHKSGLTQTDLVRATGIDRSTLADLVSRMTAKGLLDREKSVIDARAKAVRLSVKGQAALDAARPRVEAADKRIMALLPKGKRDAFLDMLADLADEADSAPDKAKAELKAAKKAARDAKKAEKAARKAEKATEPKPEKPVKPPKAKKIKVVEVV